MFTAMRIGLSGLRSTQQQLDVIGNNLTNSETLGFKSDRMTFADAFYRNYGSGTGPSGGLGGRNGAQVGLGVQIGSVDHSVAQGNLIQTGRALDIAIQGNGFFVLGDGESQYFTRAGSFSLDSAGNLVDGNSGLKVQDINGQGIVIDQDLVVPAQTTSLLQLAGNLPAVVTGPLAEIQESSTAYQDDQPPALTSTGSGATVDLSGLTLSFIVDGGNAQSVTVPAGTGAQTAAANAATLNTLLAASGLTNPPIVSTSGNELVFTGATTGDTGTIELGGGVAATLNLTGLKATGTSTDAVAATLINDLNSNASDYVPGDIIRIIGTDSTGASISVPFTFGAANDGDTFGALVNKIQGAFPDTAVQIVDGKIKVTANQTGENPLEIVLQDDVNSTGNSNFSLYSLNATRQGTGPDTKTSSITIYDSLGTAHVLTGTFERQENGTWNLAVSVPESEGSVVTGSPITGISFGADGSFQGSGSLSLDIAWTSNAAPQSLTLDLGSPGGFTGLTATAGANSAQFEQQDGYPSGTLVGIDVTGDGTIRGDFSNNQRLDLASIAIARFRNPEGLVKVGGTRFRLGDNAGQPILGAAQQAGAGTLVGGALEGSNVDTAEEFVKLIEAQRAFQGASRIISSADELFLDFLQIV
ncbi:MAG: flagellar hook-basal body complex protein [Planctomycetota bacterium]